MSASTTIDFKIVTPDGVTYDDAVEKVTIPTQAGGITVYPDHAAMVSLIAPGVLTVHKDGQENDVAISGGILEIRPDSKVYIMADTAEVGAEIDIERAEAARKRAEELLKQQHDIADVDFARIQAMIEKETARISVGTKYRKIG